MRKLLLFIAIVFLLNNHSLFSQVPSYVPTNGLVGFWPFSGNANDASTNGNNGTVNGATLTTDRNGVANSAYSFNGSTSYIDCGTNTSLRIIGNISISSWFLMDGGSLNPRIVNYGNATVGGYTVFVDGTSNVSRKINATNFNAGGSGTGFCCSNPQNFNLSSLVWHHIVYTSDSSGLAKIYIDGVQISSYQGVPVNNINYSGSFNIGRLNFPSYDTWGGKLDDIGIWNRVLTAQEVTALYTSCTPPAAPTGALTQTFCATPAPTVASLTATGAGIQWYAAATGGTALATTTALVNGTTYYATQTLNACESTTRLAVTVTLNDPLITASATSVCSGTPVTLSASTTATATQNGNLPSNLTNGLVGYWPFNGNANDVSGNANNGTVNGATLTTDRFGNSNSAYLFNRDALNYITFSINNLPINNNSKTISVWTKWNSIQIQNAFHIVNYGAQNLELDSAFGLMIFRGNSWYSYSHGNNDLNSNVVADSNWTNLVTTYVNGQRKIYVNGILANSDNILLTTTLTNLLVGKSVYATSDSTNYFNGKIDEIGIWNRALSTLEVQQLYNSGQPTYLWSTGETTATINLTPTATTTYWCDVTVNGVTCRKTVTITVNTTPVPTGTATQTFCATPAPTIASLTATGTGIQWYAAATGGTPLVSSTALVNGTTYYATQTQNACESTTRLAVTVTLNDPQITASATTVCSGTPVTLSASTNGTLAQFQAANTDLILFHTIGSHSYFYKNLAVTWQQAKAHGDQIGLSMYVINDATEELSVYNSIPSRGNDGKQYWIGLYQDLTSPNYSEPSGGWKWVDNTPLIYTNWYPVEPNNSMNGENFGQFDWAINGIKWNDAGNSTNNNGCACDLAFPIYEFQNQANYLWSTGATTATINPSPTATTTYWCDVTVNGVTCRKSVTVTVNTPVAPTGALTQTFCATPAPTIASLTVTGTGIQWYAAATGGTPLTTTTALVNGTTYYASQTVSGCESTTRLAVTVTLNDPQITASATTVCSGTPVTLSASTTATIAQNCNLPANLQTGLVGYWPFCGNANDVSGNANNGTVNGATLTTDRFGNANSAYNFDGVGNYIIVPSNNVFNSNDISVSMWVSSTKLQRQIALIRLTYSNASNEHFGIAFNDLNPYGVELAAKYNTLNCLAGQGWQKNEKIQNILDNNFHHVLGTISGNTLKIYIDGNLSQTLVTPYLQTSNCWNGDIQIGRNWSSLTDFFRGKIDDIGIWNRTLSPSEAQQLYTAAPTYLWSTGDTTATINPSPTATTTYWCDVTVNGVTCRKTVTITVNTTPTPTGTATQTFCASPAPTVSSLTAIGTGILWYAAATGGTPLVTTTALVNGTTYYATQTVSGCESTARLAVTVTLNDPQITASATTVCSGTPVTLSASTTATVAQNCNLPSNLTNGLVGYWPFCGNANDVSGNANNGTVNGATLTTDRFGNSNSAYSFNGVSNYINLTNSLPDLSNFTLSGWFYHTKGSSYSGIFSDATQDGGNDLYFNMNSTSIGLKADKSGSLLNRSPLLEVGVSSIPLISNLILGNSWKFITITVNQNETKVYLDGNYLQTINQGGSNVGYHAIRPSIGRISDQGYDIQYFQGKLDDFAIYNRVLSPSEISQLYSAAPAYLWSTGETTATINPSPTATTTYWCDVTVNGVTCRKSVTITVNNTPAPTGALTQTFCATPTPTLASLTATGTGVQWYAAANGGTALATTTALVNGTTYYATQTLNACESTTRLAVTVTLNDPQITANATTVCSGTPVTLNASTTATVAQNCNLPANLQTGLVGYWPFCGNANDVSGNANNGTVNGATLAADRFGNANSAYSFDGNDYISTQINRGALGNLMTISAFYKFTGIVNINHSAIIGSSNTIGTDFFIGKNNFDTNIGVQDGNYNHQFVVGSNAFDGNWHNIIYTFENNTGKIYLDGILKNTGNFSKCKISDLLNIGTEFEGSGYYFYGPIDDVGFWNRVLSPTEITQLYNSNQATYLWSTGATTATINPSPTATTTYWCDVTVNGVTCRKSITITVNPNSTPTFTQVAPICNGGTLAALPTTSSNSINGVWSPALNNTATTTYTFTPTAGQCATTATMTITVNPNSTPTFTQVAPICNGATVAALPTTSTNSFTGTWSPALNNTATTTYTFTPTAGQCATTATMTITVNPNSTPTFTQVAPICNGATLAALPTTSSNTITGTWSPALNNTATTTYTFTPTAGLCATTATMTITVNPLPIAPTGTITQTFCANIYPTLQNIVVTPSNINWYTSLTSTTPLPLTTNLPVGSTTYYASQFDAVTGCSSNVRLTVVATVLLENTPSTLTDQTFCSTDIKTLADVKTNGLNIVWYSSSSGGTPLLDSYLLTSSQSLYAAIYNAASGCESPIRQMVQITIINCQLVPNNLLTLNDNSLNDNLTIENIENFPINQIEIYNRFGELVWKTEYYDNDSNTFKGRANVSGVFQKDSDLPTGTYYFILKYYDSYRGKYTDLKSFLYINNNN